MGEPELQPARGEAAHRRGSAELHRCLCVIAFNTGYPGGWSVWWDGTLLLLHLNGFLC